MQYRMTIFKNGNIKAYDYENIKELERALDPVIKFMKLGDSVEVATIERIAVQPKELSIKIPDYEQVTV
jgi:hypothetical protein